MGLCKQQLRRVGKLLHFHLTIQRELQEPSL